MPTSVEIAPSILSCDPTNYATPVREMMAGGADWIHLDVMDGQFVPPITFGADLAKHIAGLGETPVEAHLMTQTPELHFASFVQAGCRRITFHAEATQHSYRACQHLRSMGVGAGVAVNPGSPESALEAVADVADLFLVMTVNPGWGGQALIESCVEKVRRLRKLYPHHPIEVDGGVDAETVRRLYDAGATVFVTGSYLNRSRSIRDGIMELRAKCL